MSELLVLMVALGSSSLLLLALLLFVRVGADSRRSSSWAAPGSARPLLALGMALCVVALAVGCGAQSTSTVQPESSVYAPAELVAPYIPEGEPVDPSTVRTLTLDQLLVFAHTHSPQVRTAEARVALAGARVIGAQQSLPSNPELGVGAGARTSEGAAGVQFEASLEQQLEVAGEAGLRVDAAEAERVALEAAVNEAHWATHVLVHQLVVDLILVAERRAQAERFVAFSESLREIARRQVEAGDEPPLILFVADADLAETREVLISLGQEEAVLRTRLSGAIGWPTEMLPEVVGALPEVQRAPDVSELLQMMAQHHPSIRARELAVEARAADLELERREAWPEPTVGVAYGREAGLEGEAGSHLWLFNVSAPIPLWRTNQEGQAQAEAELLIADRERAETVTNLRSELVQAVVALNSAAERVDLYADGVVPQLAQNLALLQRAYEEGEIDVHEVSQTRQRLLDATSRYVDARVTYFESAATLEGLVGTELWEHPEVAQ